MDDKNFILDKVAVTAGSMLYKTKGCGFCHGFGLLASAGPDLRESSIATDREVLRAGALAPKGMPRFSELTDSEINNLFMYIRASAREAAGGRKITPEAKAGTL